MNITIRILLFLAYVCCLNLPIAAQSGYRLWLDFKPLPTETAADYKRQLKTLLFPVANRTDSIARQELLTAVNGLLGEGLKSVDTLQEFGTLVIGTPATLPWLAGEAIAGHLQHIGDEGYGIHYTAIKGKPTTVIFANTSSGILYGVYAFLGVLQRGEDISQLATTTQPKIALRLLNHWDNLDRTVERGYAGFSLWDWHRLPGYRDPRYTDYARANASIGINGTVLNNVNANALMLTAPYLEKAAALADIFRPYGIKVYLSARFSAPIELGGLADADPLNPEVQQWWNDKVAEIYRYIPDFGGFLVKANSEGQPGPQNYGRSHAEGANMLADALNPHGGVVMWRAFVYEDTEPEDRAKQAYNEFKPLDGQFRENVIVQVKNGAIDFQPREPFHPLFGAMPGTPLMMEFQITQEYLGFATNLAYLGTLFSETLLADTYAHGPHSTVARIIDGSLTGQKLTAMAGVANTGTAVNWTGHPFAQANWFAYGKLAWDPDTDASAIADDWLRRTFGNDASLIGALLPMMMQSRETIVNYMTPLGLHHLMGWSHHYGPGPWIKDKQRADWTSVYYHQANKDGIGFNRTASGSDALSQYAPEVQAQFEDPQTCPDEYLLWFHHLPWDFRMKSGETLWEALCHHYYSGVEEVAGMRAVWKAQKGKVNDTVFEEVSDLLAIQHEEAMLWRDACVLYFQQFSGMPIPDGLERPEHPLEYYENLQFHFVPGI
ncbi:alpha-glucuronidase [Parapedobacter sp. ISTM3]|uniref:alpha-glucuronidase family glycosyl hydrolase n=1 Tax=Parapedobacter sp. ISTM3 TaxID=2800130 RepID=UPI00190876DC|nr:alpha-glucuronidase family glycosyl hydrolase [Parapedobacter sp. ISTM3]MBK1439542.1 alpha-glucuronidase [Parapedobacter sp. ISTM3]